MNLSRRQIAEIGRVIPQMFLERLLEGRFFLNLEHGSPPPVYIGRDGRSAVRLHPPDEFSRGLESVAEGKNFSQPVAGAPDQFIEKAIGIAIDIAEERQVERIVRNRHAAVSANVINRVVPQDDQSSEMKCIELSEGNQWVVHV